MLFKLDSFMHLCYRGGNTRLGRQHQAKQEVFFTTNEFLTEAVEEKGTKLDDFSEKFYY